MDNEEQRTLFSFFLFVSVVSLYTVQRERGSLSVIKWIYTFCGKEHRHGGCPILHIIRSCLGRVAYCGLTTCLGLCEFCVWC